MSKKKKNCNSKALRGQIRDLNKFSANQAKKLHKIRLVLKG